MPVKKAAKNPAKPKRIKTATQRANARHSKRLREEAEALAKQKLSIPIDAEPDDGPDDSLFDEIPLNDFASRTAQKVQNGDEPKLTMIARVNRAIEQELEDIEDIAARGFNSRYRTDAERRARTLASLARTLREVMLLREQTGEGEAQADDEDSIPRDLDEFRRELSRRLEAMVARGAQHTTSDDDAS